MLRFINSAWSTYFIQHFKMLEDHLLEIHQPRTAWNLIQPKISAWNSRANVLWSLYYCGSLLYMLSCLFYCSGHCKYTSTLRQRPLASLLAFHPGEIWTWWEVNVYLIAQDGLPVFNHRWSETKVCLFHTTGTPFRGTDLICINRRSEGIIRQELNDKQIWGQSSVSHLSSIFHQQLQ